MAGRSKRPVAVEFGRRVREHREALGWSQMKLAEVSGLHFTYVSSVERGERNVSLVNIVRISRALQVDAGELVTGLATKPKRL